ncbi:MAG: phosphatase PAP2 family protein [Caldilineaceae bacterium]|nr:phosphatase PAP2 family protein [Caldilineaceae bacterium]
MTEHTAGRGRPFSWSGLLREYLAHSEITILLAIAIVAGGTWAFIGIAGEVLEGDTHAFDERLLLALRNNPNDLGDPIGPPWFEEIMRDYTALGGVGVLSILTLGVIGYLLLAQKRQTALFVLVTIVGGMLVSLLLKGGFSRPRPDLVPYGSVVLTSSFPSGHSMLSASTYLTLGALLTRLQPNRRLKIYILAVAVLLTVLVGVSRVYLGVHWPTDVAAGWTAGAVWAALCWLVARWLQHRGAIEREAHDDKQPEHAPVA